SRGRRVPRRSEGNPGGNEMPPPAFPALHRLVGQRRDASRVVSPALRRRPDAGTADYLRQTGAGLVLQSGNAVAGRQYRRRLVGKTDARRGQQNFVPHFLGQSIARRGTEEHRLRVRHGGPRAVSDRDLSGINRIPAVFTSADATKYVSVRSPDQVSAAARVFIFV